MKFCLAYPTYLSDGRIIYATFQMFTKNICMENRNDWKLILSFALVGLFWNAWQTGNAQHTTITYSIVMLKQAAIFHVTLCDCVIGKLSEQFYLFDFPTALLLL